MAASAVAIAIGPVALIAPASADAGVLDVYQALAKRRLSPPPLVPTRIPPVFSPVDRSVYRSTSRRRNGYGIRLAYPGIDAPKAVLVITGGDFSSLAAGLRDAKRAGLRARSTRVRGHRGYVLTRSRPTRLVLLLWSENRRVYSVSTGTTSKVSLTQLRATAAGLDPLEREYIGSVFDEKTQSDHGAVLVSTKRTISGTVEWSAPCVAADGSPGPARAGSMDLTLAPRSGNSFAFPLKASGSSPAPWTGQLSGTISPGAITVSFRATVNVAGDSCDTGPVSIVADKRSI